MRDDDDREPRPRREMVCEPRDDLDVEMVSRLVEQQQVEVGDESSRQLHPASLATRHRAHPPGEERLVETAEQSVEDLANRRIAGPLVHVLPRHDVLRHGHLRIEGFRLRHGTDVHARVDRDAA